MRIEFDSEDQTITVDGVKISLELLHAMANPDPLRFYSMVREGDTVTVQGFQLESPMTEARSTAN